MPSVSLADVSAGLFRFIGSRSDSDRTDVASGDQIDPLREAFPENMPCMHGPLVSLVGPYCA